MLTRCEAGLQAESKNSQCNTKYWQEILLIYCY